MNFDYSFRRARQNNPVCQDAILDRLDAVISSKDIVKCPIVGKIYNLDATKKSTIELINNMNKEISEIIGNREIDEYDKRTRIKDCKGMYYEIIYRALKNENIDSKKFEMIKKAYGEDNDLTKDISSYFEDKRAQELKYINGVKKVDGIKEKSYQNYCNSINKNTDEKIEFIEGIQVKYNNYDGQNKNIQTVVTDQKDSRQETQEQDINNFVEKFIESYKQFETNAQYDKRIHSEENDMESVVSYIKQLSTNKINSGNYFRGLHPTMLDKCGRIDFSQDNIDWMFRLLNASNNLTIGNYPYDKTFCMSSEIKEVLKLMQKSPKVQEMIRKTEIEKAQGKQSRASLREKTPFEKQTVLAKKAFYKLKQEKHYSDNDIINVMIGSYHMNSGYDSKEELALARIACMQRGIKTKPKNYGEKYRLDIILPAQDQDRIEPQKIKQDTIVAGINISEINKKTKEIKDSVLNVGEKTDIQR